MRRLPLAWVASGLLIGLCTTVATARRAPADPEIGPDTVVIVPYQAGDYRHLTLAPGDPLPIDYEKPVFDDSAFAWGTGAFGSPVGSCAIHSTVATTWALDTTLVVRRVVSLPPGATNVRVMAMVDNDILEVYFNGTQIGGPVSHDYCPELDDFRFDVSDAIAHAGDNVLVFHLRDRGVESFFDARVLADVTDLDVLIDIKPGSFPNGLNPRQRGVTPVAIMTTAGFNAATVDRASIRFGRTGIETAPVHAALEDWDRDGDLDLILQFDTLKTGILCGDLVAHLTAETTGGTSLHGSDSLKTSGCK